MKVLFLRVDKAGDALKSLPALRALQLHPVNYEYHILTSPDNASLFEFEPELKCHIYNKGLPASIQNEEFDIVINLQCDFFPRTWEILLKVNAKKKYTVPIERGVQAGKIHQVPMPNGTPSGQCESSNIAHIIFQVLRIPLSVLPHVPPRLGPQDMSDALKIMGPKEGTALGFCPFAGRSQRSQSQRRWQAFAQKVMAEKQFDRYFVFGPPSELRNWKNIPGLNLISAPHFRALAAYFSLLDAMIGLDSGPLHLAQALDLPSLGILSGGDVKRWYSHSKPKSLLRRGIFSRFPSVWEMQWAYTRWYKEYKNPSRAALEKASDVI